MSERREVLELEKLKRVALLQKQELNTLVSEIALLSGKGFLPSHSAITKTEGSIHV